MVCLLLGFFLPISKVKFDENVLNNPRHNKNHRVKVIGKFNFRESKQLKVINCHHPYKCLIKKNIMNRTVYMKLSC